MTLKLPEIKHPTHTLVLPSCNEELLVRPYSSKEEKILLMAALSDSAVEYLHAAKQIVQNCVIQWCKSYQKVDDLPTFDFDYLLLQLRIISVGEKVSIRFKGIYDSECTECQKDLDVEVDLTQVQVENPKFDRKIILNEDYGVLLKYFAVKDQNDVFQKTTKETPQNDKANSVDEVVDTIFRSMAHCIDAIFSKEEVIKVHKEDIEQVKGWLENLPREARTKIEEAINQTPILKHEITLQCKKCGKKQKHIFEGLESFFV